MSAVNGSTYRRSVTRSVYSDSLLPEIRRNGYPTTPQPPPSMTYLEAPSLPRAPSRARTPTGEVSAVDPTLEDAQKTGNNYHITMSLNAALAEAGLPPSVAMTTGRRSQMEYATNSRAASAAQSEYATNSQRGSSRLGFVGQVAPARTNERTGSVSVVRVTGDDVIRTTGNDVLAHAHFSFPVTQPRDDQSMTAANESYTIRSVHPSSSMTSQQKTTETMMTSSVDRPKSRVGFDLELFGGQTTIVTETSAASDQRSHNNNNNGSGNGSRGGRDGRDGRGGQDGVDGGGGGGGGGTVASLTKSSQRSNSNIGSLPKASPRQSANNIGALPRATPRSGGGTTANDDNHSNWNNTTTTTTSEWTTEAREEPKQKRSGQMKSGEMRSGEMRSGEMRSGEMRSGEMRSGQQMKSRSDDRNLWNPGDSTKHISDEMDQMNQMNQMTETRMQQRPSGVGSGVKGSLRSGDYGAMSRSGDTIDGYESIEYETVRDQNNNPWLINGMDGFGGGGGGGGGGADGDDESLLIYRILAKGADPSTVRQEVIYGEKEMEIVRQKNGRIQQDLLNVDIVSENVTVVVGNNLAQMTIMVRTERIVPIDESKELLFQKSSVTVTRLIEVDMMATPERQRIYDQVLQSQRGGRALTLSQKQTFDLYKAFLRLTETDSGHALHEQVRIDKETDQATLTDLDLQREYHIDLMDPRPVATSTASSRSRSNYASGGGYQRQQRIS